MATILKDAVMIEGLTLASVVWRKFHKSPLGFVEKVLDLNPGLAFTPIIPVGTEISFPVEEMDKQQTDRTLIRLWDDS